MITTLVKGFTVGGSLIVAIGAQNAFVIRQGLLRRQLLLTALLCSLIDSFLIVLGVLGFGQIISSHPVLMIISKYFAISFLFAYGCHSLYRVFKRGGSLESAEGELPTTKQTVLMLLALSLLNPHAYLDTVVLLGSIATHHPADEQVYFVIGAICSSFLWFFAITYGGKFLAPLFKHPMSWCVIDCIVSVTMWAMAITLLFTL